MTTSDNNPVSQPEAFKDFFAEAQRAYENERVLSLENALLEVRFERVPEIQWPDFNAFCKAMGQPLNPDNPRYHRSRNIRMTAEESDDFNERCREYDEAQLRKAEQPDA